MTHTNRVLQMTLGLFAIGSVLSQVAFAPSQTPAVRPVARDPYAVTVESYRTLASHTAYHPTDLASWGDSKRLPIVAWGNGACARNGMAFAEFLMQIASHDSKTAPLLPNGLSARIAGYARSPCGLSRRKA